MKYMGSKIRIAKDILAIILKDRKPWQLYVEPFAGGMNSICEVTGPRIANDSHFYLIEMWKALVDGSFAPRKVTQKEYQLAKCAPEQFPPAFVGWAGFTASYAGKIIRSNVFACEYSVSFCVCMGKTKVFSLIRLIR